jgi:mannose-6-phosphate isomerase-like protein (cupin superfamily)
LQIEPAEFAGKGDTVAVRLEVAAGTAAPFLGMPVTGFRPWGSVEVFRVVAGQIVARWGEPGGYGLFEPIATEVFAGLDMADARPTLTRRSYEPGASDWDAPSWGPVLMIAESGTVIVDVDAIVVATVRRGADAVDGDPTTIRPVKTPTPVTLAPGDVLTVAERAKIETRNESDAPAAVLVLTLRASPSIPQLGSSRAALPLGVRTSALTVDIIGPATTAGTVAVSVGRALLAPGTGLAPHPVSGYELTLVESGTLTLQVDGVRPWARQPNGRATTLERAAHVAAGMGLAVQAGAVASYRNDASTPLALFVVNVHVATPTTGP